jgi:hypothetical protein
MDWSKIIDAAKALNVPGLAERGMKLAADTADYVQLVRTNAAKAPHLLAAGTREELDAVHAEALRVNDALAAEADAASKR